MNLLHLSSWYYQGAEGEHRARDFFGKLQASTKEGIKFPLDCPFQVALVHCTAEGEEHWCVGVLVMRGTAGDDSQEQSDKLHKWYELCGADPSGTDQNSSFMILPSVEGTLQSRYGTWYTSLETFGTL